MSNRPFHCGTQSMDWEESNCNRCKKGAEPEATADAVTCDIQKSIWFASFDDGTVTDEIAERMGYLDNKPPRQQGFSYNWRCKEFERLGANEQEA